MSYNGLDKKTSHLFDNIIQYTTMPAAAASIENKIIQYVGETTPTYTQGYFYKCVIDTNAPYTGAKLMAVVNDALTDTTFTHASVFDDIVTKWSGDTTFKFAIWKNGENSYYCALSHSITVNGVNLILTPTWYRGNDISLTSTSVPEWQTITSQGSQQHKNNYIILDSFYIDYPGFEEYKWEKVNVQDLSSVEGEINGVKEVVGIYDQQNYFNTWTSPKATGGVALLPDVTSVVTVLEWEYDNQKNDNKFTIDVKQTIENTYSLLDGITMETKYAKNLPNGAYKVDGLYLITGGGGSPVPEPAYAVVIYGCNEATKSNPTRIATLSFDDLNNMNKFVIDSTYEYNWVDFEVYSGFTSSEFHFVIRPITQDANIDLRLKLLEDRPMVPRYNPSFVHSEYDFNAVSPSPVPGSIYFEVTTNIPSDDMDVPSIETPGYMYVEGWDAVADKAALVPVPVKPTSIDTSSISAGQSNDVVTFLFSVSQVSDVEVKGVLNLNITFSGEPEEIGLLTVGIYDNQQLVETYNISVNDNNSTTYQYLNYDYIIEDCAVGNHIVTVRLTAGDNMTIA